MFSTLLAKIVGNRAKHELLTWRVIRSLQISNRLRCLIAITFNVLLYLIGEGPMVESRYRLFGEKALEFGYLTCEQLNRTLEIQSTLRSKGRIMSVGQIMREEGFITDLQIRRILSKQKKELMECRSCSTKFNVKNYNPDITYVCKKCGGRLLLLALSQASKHDEETGDSAILKSLGNY